jgi:FkbM family methyltransferase
MNFSRLSSQSLMGRTLRLPLRLVPKNVPVPILQGPLRGRKWIAGSSDHGCWLGSYEYEKQKVFASALRPGDIVYDLGANAGFYSLMAAVLTGPAGQVAAFEPDPENVTQLRRHLELNLVANCSVFQAAVSCSDGHGDFVSGTSCSTGHLAQGTGHALRVRTVTLDNLVGSGQLQPPDIIKCDIEGAEHDALLGAAEILRKHAPMIFLATHGSRVHALCCNFLLEIGYNLTPIDGLQLEQASEILARRESAHY